jgi:hypothetical protein
MVAQMDGHTKISVIDVTMKPVAQFIVHLGSTDKETGYILINNGTTAPSHTMIPIYITQYDCQHPYIFPGILQGLRQTFHPLQLTGITQILLCQTGFQFFKIRIQQIIITPDTGIRHFTTFHNSIVFIFQLSFY